MLPPNKHYRKHYRFAPSPTHYMHQGNAVSACLNYILAQQNKARFTLRIEDIDHTRCKPEYTQAIYDDLHWLGIKWHDAVRVQSKHIADYDEAINKLAMQGVLYGCQCSRKDYQHLPHYPATCRANIIGNQLDLQMAIQRGNAIRINIELACSRANIPNARIRPCMMRLLRRRDIGTSYHIAVVVDDALQGITHIVRGSDLEAITPLHLLLQKLLGLPAPHYQHHALILNAQGEKLSKSAKDSFRLRDLPCESYWQIAWARYALRQVLNIYKIHQLLPDHMQESY